MTLPDCPYRGEKLVCDATEFAPDNTIFHPDVHPLLVSGACCCPALLCTGHCPEGWR